MKLNSPGSGEKLLFQYLVKPWLKEAAVSTALNLFKGEQERFLHYLLSFRRVADCKEAEIIHCLEKKLVNLKLCLMVAIFAGFDKVMHRCVRCRD
jgi:hypothetical protein